MNANLGEANLRPKNGFFTPLRGNQPRLVQSNDGNFGTPLERILDRRPSIAAAMLSSWNNSAQDNRKMKGLKSSLSQSDVKKSNLVTHKPPRTPVSERQQCYSSKLRRRNAMTRSDIRMRNWGTPSPTSSCSSSTKRVECLVILNPVFESKYQCPTPIARKRSKAEFAYFSNTSYEQQKSLLQSPIQNPKRKRNKTPNSQTSGFFKSVISKMKSKGRNEDSTLHSRQHDIRGENFLLLWQSPANMHTTTSFSKLNRSRTSSPVIAKAMNRTITESRLMRRLSQESLTTGYCLNTLLQSKKFKKRFREFLVGEFSEENLDFWIECETYRKSKDSKLKNQAEKLYKKYLYPGTLKEVNVDGDIRARVECELFNPRKTTFDQAQEQVYKLMSTDSFPRFLDICKIWNEISNF